MRLELVLTPEERKIWMFRLAEYAKQTRDSDYKVPFPSDWPALDDKLLDILRELNVMSPDFCTTSSCYGGHPEFPKGYFRLRFTERGYWEYISKFLPDFLLLHPSCAVDDRWTVREGWITDKQKPIEKVLVKTTNVYWPPAKADDLLPKIVEVFKKNLSKPNDLQPPF